MARPQVIVNVSPSLPKRGIATATGTLFVAFSAGTTGTGPTDPVRCASAADVIAAYGSSAPATLLAAQVGDALAAGAPVVVTVRVAPAAATVTQTEWAAALTRLTDDLGPGQVAIPGVSTAVAQAALVAHAAAFPNRVVLLDVADNATVSEMVAVATTANGTAAAAPRVAVFANSPVIPTPAGSTRVLPGSAAAAALAARNDAIKGHTNHAPAGDQGRDAGAVSAGTAVSRTFSAAELDALYDGGVNVFRLIDGAPTLYSWRSVSMDARFRQLNAGRFAGQLGAGIFAMVQKFLFREIDGKGGLFAEMDGALRGYLAPLQAANAIYGTDDNPGFDVEVAAVNTPATIAAGELRAAIAVRLTPHTEKITIDVVTQNTQGV